MIRNARATIDLAALQHNFALARKLAPKSRVMAVVKADAYGHGMLAAAKALGGADAFAVSHLNEAIALRQAGVEKSITVFQGFADRDQLLQFQAMDLQPVVHQEWQVELIERADLPDLSLWMKVNTGMGRMGIQLDEATNVWGRLQRAEVKEVGLMSHFANADAPEHPSNQAQMQRFASLLTAFAGPASFANSAALIAFPSARRDWVRPGIMLYGASPLAARSAAQIGLVPVMRLTAELMAVNQLKKGDSVGYGHLWECPEAMPVGLVAVGYGDGYPRHAGTGTPVAVAGQMTQIIGRVSMDTSCIDLRPVADAACGDEVELWGPRVPVDEVACAAQTIAYQLLCGVSKCRV